MKPVKGMKTARELISYCYQYNVPVSGDMHNLAFADLIRLEKAEAENAELRKACEAMFREPLIKSFYESHKNMDMAFAEEVPDYKEDCQKITAAFEKVLQALKGAKP